MIRDIFPPHGEERSALRVSNHGTNAGLHPRYLRDAVLRTAPPDEVGVCGESAMIFAINSCL
jgi:hypothetical protein